MLTKISGNNLALGYEVFYVVCPMLQHLPALITVSRTVVDPASFANGVVQSLFNCIGCKILLVEEPHGDSQHRICSKKSVRDGVVEDPLEQVADLDRSRRVSAIAFAVDQSLYLGSGQIL